MGELKVRLLGGLYIEGVDANALGSRKARTLLKVLALARGAPVSADALADYLWASDPPANPSEQIGVLVSRLRRALGAERVRRTDAGYSLVMDWLDVEALQQLVEDARRRLDDGSAGAARAAAGAAIVLARGPLLPDEAEAEWTFADAALALRLVTEAHRIAAAATLLAGDFAGAALAAQTALDADPYDEAVLRTLMTAHARAGRPASALAVYAAVRERLADELGVDPAAETTALHTALLQQAPAPPGLPAPPAAPPPLPGRAGALQQLDSELDAARGGGGGLVVIEGEAGMGKTRLLSAWTASARATGATVLAGRCDEVTRDLPLQPVIAALTDHLRGGDAAETARVLGQEAQVLTPFLAGPGVAAATEPLPALSRSVVDQLVIFAALVRVLTRMPAPVVLVIDDVHFAGSATTEWIAYAAREAAAVPLLLVCAQRPEEAIRLAAGTTVRLAALDATAAAEIVGADRAAELYRRSGGNPLLLVELAAADPGQALPRSVRDAVIARCDRAGPAAAATLRAAAVLGSSVDLDLLAAVLNQRPTELLDHLEEGLRRGLLVDGPTGFLFRHDLIRESLEAAATSPRRALMHREAARVLSARATRDPLAVVHHARLGGDAELTASALVEAAAVASERLDQAGALDLLGESLMLADSLPARLLRARVRIVAGDYAGAGADADVATGLGAGAAALELAAWAAHYQRDFAAAIRLADEGAALDGDLGARVGCLTIGGWAAQCMGDLPGAARRIQLAAEVATGVWRPVTNVWLGGLRVHQGRLAEGIALLHPSTINEAVAVHGRPALHGHLFAALAFGNLGRPDRALDEVAEIEKVVSRFGVTRWEGRAENVRGWILRGLGQWDAADDANVAGLEVSTGVHMLEPIAHAHLDLAAGALARGDVDRAASEVAAAEDLGSGHALAWRHQLRARLYRGEIALAAGDPDGAAETAAAITEQAQRMGIARYDVLGRLLTARARMTAGEPADVEAVDELLATLPTLAGLEAWRLTAAVAAIAGEDRWWALAETRVVELSVHAAGHADALQRAAGTMLDRMRTATRSG